MQSRTLTLAGGAIVLVGSALAGGYYFGRNQPAPAPAAQTQAPQTQAPANAYADQQAPPQQSSSEQSAAMPQGYESAQYSSGRGSGYASYSSRSPRHRRIDAAYFHSQLTRYGRWEHSDRWGEVWQPSYVDADFRPYDRGHWDNTREFGWTWNSDYEWGSIPFHYGRWVDDPDHGWLWIPGYVWGPGWVVWRSGGRYTGWMPMPPDREFLRGDAAYHNDWREDTDYGYRDWYGPNYDQNRTASLWVFVDTGHMADRDYRPYEVSRTEDIRRVITQTTNVTNYRTVNNYVVNASIDPRVVEQASGRKVEAVSANAVLKKPELVTPVDVGRQVQVQARQENPTGIGKPNSAPPPSQVFPSTTPTGATSTEQSPFAQRGNARAGNAQSPTGNPSQTNAAGQSDLSAFSSNGRKHRFEREQGPPSAGTQAGQVPANASNTEGMKQQGAKGGVATNGEQPLPQAQTGTGPMPFGKSRTANEAAPAEPGIEARRHHRMEQQQPTGAETAAGSKGGASALSNNEPAQEPLGRNAKGVPEGGPAASALEDRRHHRLEKQTVPSAETSSGSASSAPLTNESAPSGNAPAATKEATGNGESNGFPRHGRHPARLENATAAPNNEAIPAAAPPTSEKAAASPDKANGFPRGAPENNARAASPETGQNEAGPAEQPHKKKLIVPASVEPGANPHKNAETAPGNDVRTESPPPPDNSGNEGKAKEHKGRHKNDEPGPENAPPP